jgi:hypothetical protein
MGLSSLPRTIFPKCDLQILGDSLNPQRAYFLSLSDLRQQFQIFPKGDQPISWRFSQANKGQFGVGVRKMVGFVMSF